MKKRYIPGMAILLIAITLLAACTAESPEERRARLHLPPPGFKGNPTIGHNLFNNACAQCHGVAGRGTQQGPPLIDDIYRPGHHADLAFYRAVKDGVKQHHWQFGDMPPVHGVSPEATAHIAAYIRALQRKAGID